MLRQNYVNFELIIIDDGSTDGSKDTILGIKDPRIRLISQSNAGVSAARNRGIHESKYNYIALLDADDYWEPNYLEEMASVINSLPDAALYGCAYDKVNPEEIKKVNFHLPVGYKNYIARYFLHCRKSVLFSSSSVIINKEMASGTGFFNENLSIGEDLDLWFRIGFNHQVAFYNKILAHYDMTAENRAMSKKHPFDKSILSNMHMYDQMERENADFKYFLDTFRLRKIPELFTEYDIGQKEIKLFLEPIDTHKQKRKHGFFLKMPFPLQRLIISLMPKKVQS